MTDVCARNAMRVLHVYVANTLQDLLRKRLVIYADYKLEVFVVFQAAEVAVGRAVDGEALVEHRDLELREVATVFVDLDAELLRPCAHAIELKRSKSA